MKTDKKILEPKKTKKSLIAKFHAFLKKYADDCRYSFENMLSL